MKNKILKLLFPEKFRQMQRLMEDNNELQAIAVEQIKHIRELEDRVHVLEYQEEDLELEIEGLERTVEEREE